MLCCTCALEHGLAATWQALGFCQVDSLVREYAGFCLASPGRFACTPVLHGTHLPNHILLVDEQGVHATLTPPRCGLPWGPYSALPFFQEHQAHRGGVDGRIQAVLL